MKSSNTVTLLGYYGSDMTHCLSAWQSTALGDTELEELDISRRIEKLFEETVILKKKKPRELLAMLAKHGHHTPFEKSTFHFQIRADIASHIHCIKHRIGVSINSESARYKELVDKWLIPEDWEKRFVSTAHCVGDNLSNNFIDAVDPVTWADALDAYNQLGHELYHMAIADLTPELGRKRAKESARYFFPYAKQIDFDFMANFRSLNHFLSLRLNDAAQLEIQEIAQQMLDAVASIPGEPFKYTLEAFNYA